MESAASHLSARLFVSLPDDDDHGERYRVERGHGDDHNDIIEENTNNINNNNHDNNNDKPKSNYWIFYLPR